MRTHAARRMKLLLSRARLLRLPAVVPIKLSDPHCCLVDSAVTPLPSDKDHKFVRPGANSFGDRDGLRVLERVQ
jgi:hypothetical protein